MSRLDNMKIESKTETVLFESIEELNDYLLKAVRNLLYPVDIRIEHSGTDRPYIYRVTLSGKNPVYAEPDVFVDRRPFYSGSKQEPFKYDQKIASSIGTPVSGLSGTGGLGGSFAGDAQTATSYPVGYNLQHDYHDCNATEQDYADKYRAHLTQYAVEQAKQQTKVNC